MKKLTLLSLLFLTLFACRKDVEDTLATTETRTEVVTNIGEYTPEVEDVVATLYGKVTDENGVAIEGAIVALNNSNETTDEFGRFLFKNQAMNGKGTFVQVFKTGYFEGSNRFFPKEGSNNFVNIVLMPKSNVGNFVSSAGGVVTTQDGFELDFPANSIVDENGQTFEGTVDVYARWIDPTADNVYEIMPGNLQGVDQTLEEVALASYGMVAVELESSTGQSLNLGNDLNATLKFPVPAALLADAPAEIPLWSFNTTYGVWVEEGKATLQGSEYVGEVSHFSFWNCDYPYPLIELSGTVVSGDDATPVAGAFVRLTPAGGWSAGGYTNDSGVFSGKVPANEEFFLEIQYYNNCSSVYTDNIGPFTADTDLGTITIAESVLLDITGTIVDCNDQPVTNGWVELTVGNSYPSNYLITDGTFSAAVSNCNNATEVTIVAWDIDGLEISDPITYTITDPLDLGTVQACGNTIDEYFNVTIDGVTSEFIDPYGFIAPDSSEIGSGWTMTSDYNMSIGLGNGITGVGTYDNSNVTYSNFFLPGTNGDYFYNCNNFTGSSNPCGFTTIEITTFSTVPGEKIIGTFSGVADVMDPNQQPVTLPFSGGFKITVQ